MSVRQMNVALAPALVGRLSVSGELGYEIYARAPFLRSLYQAVHATGMDLGLHDIGMYALNSLRLEKGFGIWSREFSMDYTPAMSGLSRFIDYEKSSFIGREAALQDRNSVPVHRLVTLAVDSSDADATGYEPIYRGDELVGFVTSGGYGHTVGSSLAMGYVKASVSDAQTGLTVTVAGERRLCRILRTVPVDPQGQRMRD
jgi:dimethylglycine dehydrogenase